MVRGSDNEYIHQPPVDLEKDDGETYETYRKAIRGHFDGNILNNEIAEIWLPSVGLFVYAIPALLVIARPSVHDASWRTRLGVVAVGILGMGTYIALGTWSGGQDEIVEKYEVVAGLRNWPPTFPPRTDLTQSPYLAPEAKDILLTEYEVVSEEARYRDKLLIRSSYFALAVVALFGAMFRYTPERFQPLLLMVISLVMFLFAMALVKYKDARDPLWQRQRDLERLVPAFRGRLTTFHTIRTPSRRFLDRISLSSFMTSMYLVLMVLAILGYLGTVYSGPVEF